MYLEYHNGFKLFLLPIHTVIYVTDCGRDKNDKIISLPPESMDFIRDYVEIIIIECVLLRTYLNFLCTQRKFISTIGTYIKSENESIENSCRAE